MKFTITPVVCLLLLVRGLDISAQNLLVNAGGEAGEPSTTGWTAVTTGSGCYGGAGWRVPGIQNGFAAAAEGTYLFYPGCGGSGEGDTYELMQDIDVSGDAARIDANTFQVTFSGQMQSYPQTPADETAMIVEYRDYENIGVLDSYNTGVAANVEGWVNYSDTRLAPAGTRYIRVRLIGTSRNGSSIDSYFDAISITAPTVLSVNLISFTATLVNNAIMLNWKTGDERNNKGFTVQRSSNGTEWSSIGFVPGGMLRNYSFIDNDIITGTSFYRLLQADPDNKSEYSSVRSVTFNGWKKTLIYPNPSKGTLFIKSPVVHNIELFDIQGKLIKKYPSAKNRIDISYLRNGIYTLKLTGKDGTTYTRVVKN